MFVRAFALAAGLTGAAGLSQFPEFSQQYKQRLGGAVDELSRVVAEFEADAAEVGMTPRAALADLATGGRFGAARAESMTRTMARHARLSVDLAALDDAGPFLRARLAPHMTDPDIARAAWGAYRPALPLTFEGAVFAATGFVLAWTAVMALGALLRRALRPRRRTRPRAA
ncbi:DUF2937 family protein [Roseivivax isoporae]|uniref:Prolyl-tRNA synthetase n=1 Tax=Roseivivax isoporae LMG 25204 TaxID=1449351 RepID=X7FAC3_9RHOB|nr:DUF2937 family protein [Roseivivax isoporae]ETX29765.1 prolyl-tRNA synthetase [Roseivivax isoporae LMG 25204]